MPVVQSAPGAFTKAPQQHKQPSRKGRKAWRKNVNVSEVEQGLEERNQGIIKGGIVKEQKSDELFQVDAVADLSVAKKLSQKYKKGLKADEIIAQRSAVPAVSGRKRRGDGKTTDGVIEAKRQRTDYIPQREVARLRQVANGHHESTVALTDASYDPWAANDKLASEEHASDDKFSFLPQAQKPKPPKTLKKAPISLAANGKSIPAVATPNGSFSYNPAYEEYEARLIAEGNKEVEKEKKRLEAEEAERIRMEAVAKSAAEAEEAEARAELSEWDEDSAWEGFESGVEEGTNKKLPKRKTPAQRNRIKRRKDADAKAKHEAIMQRKKEQTMKLEELLAADKEKQQLALSKAAIGADDSDGEDVIGDDGVLRRKQLGKFKLPEKNLEIMLPEELPDSLRRLKPEGNLLQDRYRSVMARGMLEARRHRPFRKQAKTKLKEKWAHKDFQLF